MSSRVADIDERAAALDPLRSFCVTAPAGSGKTELLIQRYLTLLARVEQPQEVLAITFTRKAAAEMRSRIGAALQLASAGERPQDEHEALTFDLARAVLENDLARGWQLRDNPSQLNIRTIDGFCGALTRQMPVLSRFGGPVTAVDDANPYYLEATRGLLEELTDAGPGAGDVAALLRHFDNNWQRLENLLIAMLGCRDQWLVTMGTGLDREAAQAAIERSLEVICRDTLVEADRALAPFREQLLPLWRYAADNLGLPPVTAWPGHSPADVSRWRSLANLLLTRDGSLRKTVDKRCGFPAGKGDAADRKALMLAQLEALAEQGDPLLTLLQEARELPAAGPGDRHWETVLAATRLLPRLAAQLTVVFQQHGVVDHTQVSLAALDALGEDDHPTELALKLDYVLKHILVDEFQDTAVNQFELVRRLTRGWAEHNHQNPEAARTLFIVGDGMQSIYGFRDADVGLFIRAKQQGFDALSLEPLTLKTNFRSDAGIVEWVNHSFADAFPASDDIQRGEIAFSPASAFRPAGVADPAAVMAFEDAEAEAEWIAGQVKAGMAEKDCESIAVLVRRKADLAPLVSALKRHELNWQAQEIDALADSMVVRDLENLCRALHNPLDRVAWLALLRAPWCGLDNADLLALSGQAPGLAGLLLHGEIGPGISAEGQQRLEGLQAALADIESRRERLGLRDWIEYAWLRLEGPACVEDSERLEDADAFMFMLEQFEAEGQAYDPRSLEDRVAGLFARSTAADSKLQLMTLHKAKGLEFDWVFIPNLAHATRGERKDLLLWDEYHSASGESCFMLAMDDDSDEATLYNYLYRQRKARRQTEATRLLYVGATRAAKRLWLSAVLARDDAGDWKTPPAGSLLASLWSSVTGEIQEAAPPVPPEPEATPESIDRRLLRRVLPLPPGSGTAKAGSDEPNIPEPATDPLATAIGNVVHLSLERLSRQPLPDTLLPADWEAWWRRALIGEGLGGARLETALGRVADSITRVLADPRGRWLLSPEREAAASEFAVSTMLPDGRLAEYVIDRMYIEDNVRWLVDYKSSVPDSQQSREEFLAQESARHRPQLENYRRLVESLEPDVPVRCALYFTALPHWQELD